MTGGIYCIENLINGKKYIGQAINFKIRFERHERELRLHYHNNCHLQNSWDKYGKNNFSFHIIQEIEKNQDKMNLMETYWIIYFNSNLEEFGYNMTFGGDGCFGAKRSDETKRRISESKIGKKRSEETREKMRNRKLGEESRNKISNAKKGRQAWNKGIPATEEHRKKISSSRTGIKVSRRRNSLSQYYGVSKSRNKWSARIKYMGKNLYMGIFDLEIEAAIAYNKKAIELYGDNAKLNIIKEE